MPTGSGRKRKTYGFVRDLDEEFLQHQQSDDNDENDTCGNGSHSSISVNDDDFSVEDESGSAIRVEKKRESRVTQNTKKKDRRGNNGSAQKEREKAETNEQSQKEIKSNDIRITADDEDHFETTATSTRNEKESSKTISLDSFDVVLPPSIIGGGGSTYENQCTLLVEVSDTTDAVALGEFGGSVGAIGRFESDSNGITLDLKGNQYRGSLLPGPTCMVVGFPSTFGFKKKEGPIAATKDQQVEEMSPSSAFPTLRVEAITDEYATLVQIADHMKTLDAVVIGNQNNSHETNGKNENKDKIPK
ncbi:unnamed protein product [Pseudo-nitzschia multistriata]|uniref:Uncharacterized protein n=1 Tax=Pseudo-nitzschia multistriata TaxID=183589 RepID=A0A448ZL70_9STRA|nr:unnamed protein product [Pseudo-nitzschia multistriata]